MLELGPVGIWTAHFSYQPAGSVRAAVAELDDLGYGSVWVGEAVHREPFVGAAMMLEASSRLTVGTGIANVWVRDPLAMTAAQLTLAEAYPDRFLLGLGVSHHHLVEPLRGHRYEKPLSKMGSYLDGMDAADQEYQAVRPAQAPPRVLAALGPRMLALAGERADGAHTFFVPPQHTATARAALGPDRWLIPEQAVVLERDPQRARALARRHTSRYVGLPNYAKNLRSLGFGDDDLADGGSDRLVDAIVAWGDADAVVERISEHHRAGADHVALQVLNDDRRRLPLPEWRELARSLPTLR